MPLLLRRYLKSQGSRHHGTNPGHEEQDNPNTNTKASKTNKIGQKTAHHSFSSLHLPYTATSTTTAASPTTPAKHAHFPFFRLPRELREMVYDYFRQPLGSNCIIKTCFAQRGLWKHEFDCPGPYHDDPVPLQPPPTSGIISYHGSASPPLALRLTCRQMHHELWEHFFSARFEVGPLTPHHDVWRFDPTYQKLSMSRRLPLLRNLLVRIDLVSLRLMGTRGAMRYEDIGLEDCVSKLQCLAEMLVRVLRRRGKSLQSIVIEWQDEFPEERDWGLKASVLFPFATLEGVEMRLGKLIVEEGARARLRELLEETLDGLSAGG